MLYSEENFEIMREKGYKCDLKAYNLLRECSEKEDLSQWNTWRKENPNEQIYLQGADLSGFYLSNANFSSAHCQGANFNYAHCEKANFSSAHCQGAIFWNTNCEKAKFNYAYCQEGNFSNANCQGAYFSKTNCENANFSNANCQGAYFSKTNCENANFSEANCKNADFSEANCQGANFNYANCQGANFNYANCQRAIFYNANCQRAIFYNVKCQGANFNSTNCQGTEFVTSYLQGALCKYTVLNYETKIIDCTIDDKTDFSNSSLNAIIIEPATKAKLEQNIRRKNWQQFKIDSLEKNKKKFEAFIEKNGGFNLLFFSLKWLIGWYYFNCVFKEITEHENRYNNKFIDEQIAFKAFLINPLLLFYHNIITFFWWISNYGYSTLKIFTCFFALILAFTILYCNFPGILAINGEIVEKPADIIQMITFSLATMVTLGFSNINVAIIEGKPHTWGLIIVSFNLMMGYFMLAVLVSRLAIVFQSLAPGLIVNKKTGSDKVSTDE